jgi:DNA polymerase I-like protein with 3'-5' exonuclease and polymerase domains
MTDVLGWPEQNTEELYTWLKEHKYTKSQMSLAPWEILGKYAALDADATWYLYKYLQEVIEQLPVNLREVFWDYHKQDVLTEVRLLIEQQVGGMTINLKKLDEYDRRLCEQIEALRRQFLNHEKIVPIMKGLKESQLAALVAIEPPRLTKAGVPTKRWESWTKRVEELMAAEPNSLFNIDSPKQLAWLFYTKLGFKVQRTTDKGDPSVDNKSLPYFDEVGFPLIRYRKLRDKLKFVTATRNVQIDGVLHPSMTMSGTVTGRLAGGNRGG